MAEGKERKLLNITRRSRIRNEDILKTMSIKDAATAAMHAKRSWGDHLISMNPMKTTHAVRVWEPRTGVKEYEGNDS